MLSFSYRSMTLDGQKKSGIIEAAFFEEAKEKLKEQKLIVISLKEKKLLFQRKKQAIKGEHLITFTTQLSNLLLAGMPLYESLLSITEESKRDHFYSTLIKLTEKIKAGFSLSKAMEEFPTSFDSLYCSMVHAGESVGSLDKTLEKLALLLTKQNRLKKQLLTALIYPMLLCTFSFALIFLLFIFVIPSLETLFADCDVNSFTRLVMKVSHFTTRGWPIYIPSLIGLGFLGNYLFRKKSVRLNLHKLSLKLPILRTVIIQKEVARFTRAMGTMLSGGVSIIDALQISRGVMRSPIMAAEITLAETRIIEGSLLSIELKKSPWFPPLVARMLSIGEEGGKVNEMLEKIADLYEDEVDKTLTRLTALAQPVILLIMGGVVGIIMMAVLLPLTDVSAFM